MTPREQVLKVWPDAYTYYNKLFEWHIVFGNKSIVLGAGPTSKSAWQQVAKNINQKEHE